MSWILNTKYQSKKRLLWRNKNGERVNFGSDGDYKKTITATKTKDEETRAFRKATDKDVSEYVSNKNQKLFKEVADVEVKAVSTKK